MTKNAFYASRWAAAFLNVTGIHAQEAFLCLKALALPLRRVQGIFFGHGVSEKAEKILRDCIPANDKAAEYAIRFICLLIEKKCFKHIDLLLLRIEKMLNAKNGILEFTVETASQTDSSFDKEIAQMIKEKTGAADVKLKISVNQELLAGYLLRTDGFYIDASLKGQVERMKVQMINGDGNG